MQWISSNANVTCYRTSTAAISVWRQLFLDPIFTKFLKNAQSRFQVSSLVIGRWWARNLARANISILIFPLAQPYPPHLPPQRCVSTVSSNATMVIKRDNIFSHHNPIRLYMRWIYCACSYIPPDKHSHLSIIHRHQLVIDKSLATLPRRKTDNAIIIRSQDSGSDKARVFKLNAVAEDPILLERWNIFTFV